MPQLWIIAGPNGAGKTTLTEKVNAGRIPVVNPDEIAFKLNSSDVSQVALKAGREAIRQQKAFLVSKKNFVIETTLSGNRELDLISKAQKEGFKVNLVYVGLENKDFSISRIASRVQKGGHNIPIADAVRRYPRSMQNLAEALNQADRAFVLDNSGKRSRLLITKENGKFRNLSPKLPGWFLKAVPALKKNKNLTKVQRLQVKKQFDKLQSLGR